MEPQYDGKDYVHPILNQEHAAIAGYYVLTKECRLPLHGKDVLYYVGYGVLDNSCCGMGGCAYAMVPGFVVRWRYRQTSEGLFVSSIEPIRDEAIKNEVKHLIEKDEVVSQINFQ